MTYLISHTITNSRADVIGTMLAAIAPEVDRCVVIDTGAKDATMQIAADVCGPSKFEAWGIPWEDDFSKARNQALKIAQAYAHVLPPSQRSDCWLIQADTDETLAIPGAREWLGALPPDVDVVMVPHATRQFAHPRIIRASAVEHLKWHEPVHEYLEGARRPTKAPDAWEFKCLPRPTEDAAAKYKYYARILEKGTRDDPKNARRWYYLGDCYSILKMTESALSAWDHRMRLQTKPPGGSIWECGWTAWRAAIMRFELGRLEAALDTCKRGLNLCPGMSELAYLAGWIHYGRGELSEALYYAERALEIGRPDRQGSFSYPPAQTTLPTELVRWCKAQLQGSEPSR